MERNLFLAILLTGLVVFVWPFLFKTPPPPPAAATTKSGQSSQPVNSAPTQGAPAPAATAADLPGQVHADQAQEFTIETDLYRVRFSNHGGVVLSWVLKNYKDGRGQPLELVNQLALAKVPAPFSIVFRSQGSAADPNLGLYKVERTADGLGVAFEYSDGRTSVKKTFQFAPKSYLVQVSSQVLDNGVLAPHGLLWRGGFGDSTVVAAATDEHTLYYDEPNSKLNINQIKTADKGPVATSGQYSFAGLEDKYFAGVALPGANSGGASNGIELTTFSDPVPVQPGIEEKRIGASVGGSGLNTFTLYVGPKDQDVLRAVNPKLEQLIDWGWFGFLAKPLFAALNWTVDHLTHSYGWAIVVVTVFINMVLFPLRLTSMKSAKKMQALQPQIKAINEKYKGMTITDPRKTEQNQEMMDLYKKNGVNPAGGCVPMALQIPFFIAFYKVLYVAIEMRGASWLWVSDLSQPEITAIRVLPIILIVTQFLSQKLTPNPGMDPTQQKMMLLMPLGLCYVFWFLSAGTVLYYLTSNTVSIVQQLFLNRGSAATQLAVAGPSTKKKK
ncbi:MAG TPA: membrane protein insertase YidC [Bryobacteraceae bacterium]|nr:membrane protein insertase YidC [Bryobacteraceae bacterium]